MYRYTLKERVFIVRTYWKTESIRSCHFEGTLATALARSEAA